MREEAVAVRGATLWTVTTGQGSDAVVLCHGGPGLSDNLEPVASMIEDLEALRAHWHHDSWIVGGHS